MRQKRKLSSKTLLENIRGQQADNNSVTSQDLPQQIADNQLASHSANENTTSPTFGDDNFSSSSLNEATNKRQKNEPLLVKIRDTSSGEITTRKMQPDRVWSLGKSKKVIVEINVDGQGSDNGSNLLVRFLGKVSQKSALCPISVQRWDRMPSDRTRAQWEIIEAHFEFDYVAGAKWVMHSLGNRWKAYKQKLRCKRFYPNKTKEEILANPPSYMDSSEWAPFVHHYCSRKMKELSIQNARSRANLKVTHAGGSKSNSRRGRQMELDLGRPVCRGEIVLSILLKGDGNYVNEEGQILADKIKEHLPQDLEDAATLGVPLKVFAHPDDAIGKTRGPEHSGRVRGLGGNVCPTAAFGIQRSSTSHVNFGGSSNVVSQRVEDLENQVETLKEQLIGYEETKERLAQNENHLALVHKFLLAKFGSELPLLSKIDLSSSIFLTVTVAIVYLQSIILATTEANVFYFEHLG